MTPEQWKRVESLFASLTQLSRPEQLRVLEAIEDADIRVEVESLLAHAGETGTFGGVIGAVAAKAVAEGSEAIGSEIGPYKLVAQIGEGGMGVVYKAQQTQPIRRDVALKIVKPGMDSRQVIARFESERQALAMMEHPNIAKVLDAGTTPSRRPFFVMELVDGKAITQYCDERRLTPRERLALFIPVCQAIQHAHQKGIIHRDIKPSNILVTEIDGKPAPKVIDFGIAKAVGPRLQDETQFTNIGTIVGTLEYMSPEQADLGGTEDIDTRADIYSLGAVLYELLVGVTPLYSVHDSIKAGVIELIQRIKEEEPAPPSARLSRSTATITEVSERRRTDPGRLPKLVSGELDWIVMKALEKDRARRYETANGLLRDIQRYLDGEPVEAGPPSATYRLMKIARKYRVALATAAAFLTLLIVAVAATSYEAIVASRAEQVARATNSFLEDDLLAQASARRQAGGMPDPDVKVRTVLDRAAKAMDGKFPSQPMVEASLRRTIGRTYEDLGLYAEARRQFERAQELFGKQGARRELLSVQASLAVLDIDQGKTADAEAHLRPVLEEQRRVLGAADADTLDSMDNMAAILTQAAKYDEAENLLQESLRLRRQSSGESSRVLDTQLHLGNLYRDEGKHAQAESADREGLELARRVLGPEHPTTLSGMAHLGEDYRVQGKYPEAEAIDRDVLTIKQRVLGPGHPETMTAAGNLAGVLFMQAKWAQAEEQFRSVADGEIKTKGPDHPDTLSTRHNLAWSVYAQARYADALKISEDVYGRFLKTLGPEHPRTLQATDLLGAEHAMLGDYAKAEAIHRQSLAILLGKLGPKHPQTLQTMNRVATVCRMEGKLAEAAELQAQILDGMRGAVGPEHPNTLIALNNLALSLHLQHEDTKAEALLRPALEIQKKKYPQDWQRYRCESLLGASLAGQKRFAEAEPLLVSGYTGMLERKVKIPADALANLTNAAKWTAEMYQAWGKPEKAAEWREKGS